MIGAPVRIALPDLAASAMLGARIAAALRPGDVIALSGGLGTGKTTLARAILRALGYGGEVPSPSFAILESYLAENLRVPVVHADFYRLSNRHEVDELGLDDDRADAALIAEWPEHVGGFANEPACLQVTLATVTGSHEAVMDNAETVDAGRIATVAGGADWLGRMPC